MSMSITIHPFSNDLHMYGDLDPGSAYSLSGHISIAVSSPYSLFESRRTARLLLQSLCLTFEGQSEIFTPSTGYSSLCLCSITRELAPSVPIELSNEGHEDDTEPCVWNITFNLPIPGWLPATTLLGVEEIGVRYGLYATAKFASVEEEPHASWVIASLCAPFRSRIKSVEARKPITLRRFISAPKPEITPISNLNYLVNSTPSSSDQPLDKERIPLEVLSKIQVLASVPEYVDVNDNLLPLTLRLRTKDLCEQDCKKLQVTNVAVDIYQQEKCRYRPSAAYLSRYPLPPQAMQPPNVPLIDPHPASSIYDVGLYVSAEFSEAVCRTFSLLPSPESGRYKLAPENYVFANDARTDTPPTWYTMDTTIPFVHRDTSRSDEFDSTVDWAGMKDLRATAHSPLYSVLHEVAVSLTCTYDLEGGKVATERLSFRVPLTFGNVAPKPSVDPSRSLGGVNTPAPMNLPAYSELYDSSGERKIDYSTPLPLYTPRSLIPPAPSETSSELLSTSESQSLANVNVYHDRLGGDSEKRHTPVLVQDVASSTP
ncbi:hypothetical protein GALMADRAFT_72170 [Galerina marginata CBS 339.88]|uniref:Arrestin-like N-terminal domain-containing protein n=1 Tax=Galerina marginata (strain CBS 339.88) TaxID=685588 RepID=A0A067SU44_GALM3|nr:hypothetical protein GALMADRAFT_72170 [Galerina marginata CBS 339.88]